MSKTACVILAAGKGVRMGSEKSKVLHPLCGKPLLSYVIACARETNMNPIHTIIGHGAEKVKAAFSGENLKWVLQEKQMGTAHAISLAAPLLRDSSGTLVVLCGDAPLITAETLNKLVSLHEMNKDTAVTVLSGIVNSPNQYGRLIRNATGQLMAIIETSNATEEQLRINEINSGIYAFNPQKLFDAIKEVKPNSKNGEYYLPDVVSLLAKKGERVEVLVAQDATECLGINSREELAKANRIMEERIQKKLINQGVLIIDPSKTYIEADVNIGTDTVIFPFTVIRSGVKIGANCEVGPFSHLRTGTVLKDHAEVGNFTETKKTKIGEHSKAKHLSYLGDTIIGNNVNIGAGTITANYDGKSKHQTVIEDGASTGSGTVLVAPVKLGKDSVTGAGAVVTKGNDVPQGVTVAGVPAKPLGSKKPKHKRKK
jgi:bifunctional UDP-N-acetylglucosamine pyrophosphorylase/glucosamine-1-phosphate N-acetyltransferase